MNILANRKKKIKAEEAAAGFSGDIGNDSDSDDSALRALAVEHDARLAELRR